MATREEILEFSEGYDYNCLHVVQQFVQKFGWSAKATAEMTDFINFIEEKRKDYAESRQRPKSRMKTVKGSTGNLREEPEKIEKLHTVTGICPCGGNMVGMPIPNCEKRKKQPVFYQECEKCTRYVEVWRKIKQNRKVYYESEGG